MADLYSHRKPKKKKQDSEYWKQLQKKVRCGEIKQEDAVVSYKRLEDGLESFLKNGRIVQDDTDFNS